MLSTKEQERRIGQLLRSMTLAEKIGQLWQLTGCKASYKKLIRKGQLGSLLNLTGSRDAHAGRIANEFQRVAVEESRLGIPLILGRDVIHGFRTILPIPLAQASSFDPSVAEEGAAMAAREARAHGIHWTFAPMVDISRDPRWGRVAEGCGEDPVLTSRMGAAMVRGFQGGRPDKPDRVGACVKHYVGYGAAEGGRDYNTTWIPEGLLRDVYLPPFHACVKAGAVTVMSAFNNLNGVPTSGNEWTLRQILKEEWGFDGFVVSDWASIQELIPHGYCADKREAALAGLRAGVDMEMLTDCYRENAESLLRSGKLKMAWIDEAVSRVLRIKMRLGLFENPYTDEGRAAEVTLSDENRAVARRAALEGCVLLKNDGLLPLAGKIRKLAVIGPLADAPVDQMGCWVMDGQEQDTVTPLAALRKVPGLDIRYAPGLASARENGTRLFGRARKVARAADAVVIFLGEEAVMSGEAHSRAFLGLPGAQQQLLREIAAAGRPLVVVVMAGRPLELGPLLEHAGALLWAWHPGTMGGPAIADLLTGKASPSGRLPMSFPSTVGQIPVYYNKMNTGRPQETLRPVGLPIGTPLDPSDFTTSYIDAEQRPLFPFGFGLTYTTFQYSGLKVTCGRDVVVRCCIRNTGRRAGTEVVQLYVRDVAASRTRPIRELKDFQRVTLKPGASAEVEFRLVRDQLAFHGVGGRRVVEPGLFKVWVGPHAEQGQEGQFTLR